MPSARRPQDRRLIRRLTELRAIQRAIEQDVAALSARNLEQMTRRAAADAAFLANLPLPYRLSARSLPGPDGWRFAFAALLRDMRDNRQLAPAQRRRAADRLKILVGELLRRAPGRPRFEGVTPREVLGHWKWCHRELAALFRAHQRRPVSDLEARIRAILRAARLPAAGRLDLSPEKPRDGALGILAAAAGISSDRLGRAMFRREVRPIDPRPPEVSV